MKKVFQSIVPPVLIRFAKGAFGTVRWCGDFDKWESAMRACTGYDAPEIARNVLEKTRDVLSGKAAFERDGVLFHKPEYNWPALACILSSAKDTRDRFEVMDFGGAIGSFFHQHKIFLNQIPALHWHVIEQEHYVDLARKNIDVPGLYFHKSIGECFAGSTPTFAYFSSVLQYLPDPFEILNEISSKPFSYLLIDRSPYTSREKDRLTVQFVSGKICRSRYPCRFFSEKILFRNLEKHWALVAKWDDSIDPCNLSKCGFKGYFFKRHDV